MEKYRKSVAQKQSYRCTTKEIHTCGELKGEDKP
jgi:hypothetical protein